MDDIPKLNKNVDKPSDEDLECIISEYVEESKKNTSAKYCLRPYGEASSHNVNSSLCETAHEPVHKSLLKDTSCSDGGVKLKGTLHSAPLLNVSYLNSQVKNGPSHSLQSSSDINGITNEPMRHAGIGRGKRRPIPHHHDSEHLESVTFNKTSEDFYQTNSDFSDNRKNLKATNSCASVPKIHESELKTERSNMSSRSSISSTEMQGGNSDAISNASVMHSSSNREYEHTKLYNSDSYNRGPRTRPPRANRFYKNNNFPNSYRTLGEKSMDPRFTWQAGPRHSAPARAQEMTYTRYDYKRNHSSFRHPPYEKTYSKGDAVNIDKKAEFDVNGNCSFGNSSQMKKGSKTYNQSSLSGEVSTAHNYQNSVEHFQKNKLANVNSQVSFPQTSYSQLCSGNSTYASPVVTSSHINSTFTSVSNRSYNISTFAENAGSATALKEMQLSERKKNSTLPSENAASTEHRPSVPINVNTEVTGVHVESSSSILKSAETSNKYISQTNEQCKFSESEMSSFVRDFYSVTDVDPPYEEEFRVVKRQRKRQQKKENLTASEDKGSGPDVSSRSQITNKTNKAMHFPSATSGQNTELAKLDLNYQKFINSTLASEHSSADNSDLESLHSVPASTNVDDMLSLSPVASCVPYASYADAIRMPVTAVNKTLSGVVENEGLKSMDSVLPYCESSIQDKLINKEEGGNPVESSEWIISRLSQLAVSSNSALSVNGILHPLTPNGQNFVRPRPIAVSLEKPSFYNSSLQTNKNISTFIHPSNIQLSDRKVLENTLSLNYSCIMSPSNNSNVRFTCPSIPCGHIPSPDISNITSQSLDSACGVSIDCICNSTNIIGNLSCTDTSDSTSAECNFDVAGSSPAVVIMDNCKPSGNVSDISFGIELDEIMQLCSNDTSVCFNKQAPEVGAICEKFSSGDGDTTVSATSTCTSRVSPENADVSTSSTNAADNSSLVIIGGKKFYWKETQVNTNSSNVSRIMEMLRESWNTVERNYEKESETSKAKTRYYTTE